MVSKSVELLDLALVCMGLGEVDSIFADIEELRVPRPMFDGAMVIHQELDEIIAGQDIFADARASALSKPLDVKLLTHALRHGETAPFKDEFVLQRYRRVSPREVRGSTKLVLPNMVEWTCGFVLPGKGKIETSRSIWAETKPFHWIRIDTFPWGDHDWATPTDFKTTNGEPLTKAEVCINFAHGFAFTERYEWKVYMGTPAFPGLTIPTTPAAAMDVFKLREVPEIGRRQALRNWVREHTRKIPSVDDEPAIDVLVREHLRGATDFRWNGITCKIIPSDFDRQRNERLRVEAKAKRRHG